MAAQDYATEVTVDARRILVVSIPSGVCLELVGHGHRY
jgi:hypothetical protein